MTTDRSPRSKTAAILFAGILVVGLAGLVGFVVSSFTTAQPFTEFYVLGADGQAGNYSDATVDEPKTLTLGIENREQEPTSYSAVVEHDGTVLESWDVTLEDGQRWREAFTVTFDTTGQKRLDLYLYRDDGGDPYRELYVNLNVTRP